MPLLEKLRVLLILLPLAGFLLLAVTLLGRSRSPRLTLLLVGEALLPAAVFWGAVVAISSELLSLFHALSPVGVAGVWILVVASVTAYGRREGDLQAGWAAILATRVSLSRLEWLLVGGIVLLAAVLLLVAWVSPPNTVDSLMYHVARVAHWAQNQSLEHYATMKHHQLLKPIWAETAILHLRLLAGSDQISNLVQWSSMVLSVIGVAALAARLGASGTGSILAAGFVATLPAGILQSSSTQNDYVVAIWAVCTAFYVVTSKRRELSRAELLGLGLALGVGFLTKGPFYVYAPPLMLWFFVPRLWTRGLRTVFLEGVGLTLIAMSLNVGFWARNIQTYGGPYGPSEYLQRNLWVRFLPATSSEGAVEPPQTDPEGQNGQDVLDAVGISLPGGEGSVEADSHASLAARSSEGGVLGWLTGWADRVVRTAAFHLVTPSGKINDIVRAVFTRFPRTFDEGYMAQWNNVAWSHEDTTPNTLHFGLALAAIAVGFFMARGPAGQWIRRYGLIVLAMFGLLPVVIGHGPTIWGMRYQLPFFVLAGPVVGAVFASGRARRLAPLLGLGLMVAGLPWVLFNNTRPLIGRTPWPTRVGSILTRPSSELMFAVNPQQRASYSEAVQTVRDLACPDVGLRIDSGDLEYLFWWLFGAPESGTRIQLVYTVPRLEPLLDREFRPCAILCTFCSARTRLHGLPRIADLEFVDVFAGEGFTWDEDG